MPLSTIDTSSISGLGYGFKNRIINGDMRIDQRNAGASISVGATGGYSVDRWQEYFNGGTKTLQQVSDAPAGFTKSLKVTTTSASAGTIALVQQWFEGYNVADFNLGSANAVAFTLSFWVKSSVTGVFAGNFANSIAGTPNRSYLFTYTINAANTWEYKTITATGDTTGTWATDNTAGLRVQFGLGTGGNLGTAGSWQSGDLIRTSSSVGIEGTLNATWQITGVQLEKGTVATSFDYRPYGTELALCQRYFETNFDVGIAPADNTVDSFQGMIQGSNKTTQSFSFKVMKRAAPTMTYYSSSGFVGSPTAGQWQWLTTSNTWSNGSATQTNRATMSQFQVYSVNSLTGGQAGQVAGGWAASAEL